MEFIGAYSLVGAFALGLLTAALAIPSIIRVAELKGLYDVPDERKSHTNVVPTLGGVAIFAGIVISSLIANDFTKVKEFQFIIGAMVILFFMGVKDDILILSASTKFLGQMVAAAVVVFFGDVRLTEMHGFFGLTQEIPDYLGIIITIFTVIVITNSLNLIDGINCLSGSVSIVACGTFGLWFYFYGNIHYAILSASMVGSILGFLYFNRTPARIFMGDTGSLILGLLISVLAVKFIEANKGAQPHSLVEMGAAAAVAIAVLVIPLFDTLRVFAVRIAEKRSPFSPDRKHVHHRLLDLGFTHMQATGLLVGINLIFIVLAYFLAVIIDWGTMSISAILLGLASITSYIPVYILKKRGK